ncbi:MAG: rRNA pseudouridine synthase [Flavobacteriaceae bacterium]|nr:rRNA pseudouridine synthase [Flavobacteriaceae bacterium]
MAKSFRKGKSQQRSSRDNKPYKARKTFKQPAQKQNKSDDGLMRLNKYIANSGVCSRREADMYISVGNVTVNGEIITQMGYKVKPGDVVHFGGELVTPEPKTYVLLNKPKGFATTTSTSKGRTVMDLVANATSAKIKPIGRLGRSATGLILFTNDNDLVRKFKGSKTGVARLFHVELNRKLKTEDLTAIQEGIKIKGETFTVEEISYIDNAPRKEVGIRIKNIGNAVITKIFEHLDYEIARLDCVMIGPLTKKDIPRGHWKHLTKQEISSLMML